MVRLFTKTVKPVGLDPGTLYQHADIEKEHINLSIIEYSESQCMEREDVSIDECLEHLDTPSMTWIQINGASNPQLISTIGHHFNFHSLVLEDILMKGQRSKIDLYKDQIFMVIRLLRYDEKTSHLKDEQVSLIFGKNFLVCFFEGKDDIFLPIKERLRQEGNRIRKEGSDYLAYTLLDLVVDYYFLMLEKVDNHLDRLEEELILTPQTNTLQKIQKAKHEMIILRKAIWPMREVINQFMRLEPPLVSVNTQLYMHDVYDHTVQTIDIVEGFRDVVAGLMDIYLSNINIRTNEIMRVLTVVSTIFVPLTFITGLYGMNFDYMPELHHHWGYPLVLLTMLITVIGMLILFYRKKWI